MGVDVTFYTVYGSKVEFNNALNEFYDIFEDSSYNLDIVKDGMSREYMVLGKILYSGDDRSNNVFKEINIQSLKSLEREYKKRFIETFPDFKNLMDVEFKLLCFVHYS